MSELHMEGGEAAGFILFNGVLLWTWITAYLIFVAGWPVLNAIGMAALAAIICSMLVLPAFLLNVMAMLVGLGLLLITVVALLIP